MNKIIVLTICSIFFPIYIRVMGQDAFTTGSLMCLLLFFVYIIRKFLLRKQGTRYIGFCLSILIISLISTLSGPQEFINQNVRRFFQNACTLALFFSVVNYYSEFEYEDQKQKVESLLNLVINLIALQIIIGIIIYFYPPFGEIFSIFTTRTQDQISTSITTVNIKRLGTIIGGGEQIGELISVCSPLIIYRLLKNKKLYNYVLITIYTAGCFLSVTRSSIILMLLGYFLYCTFNVKSIRLNQWFIMSYLLVLVSITIWIYFPYIFDPIIARFQIATGLIDKLSSLSTVLNRGEVWEIATHTTFTNLSLFGNGMVSVVGNKSMHFHCLYLTLLHQLGVIGFIIFMLMLIGILFLQVKSFFYSYKYPKLCDRPLVSACLISFCFFLINEIKYEFFRGHASYKQIIFLLFAIFIFIAKNNSYRKNISSKPIS